MARALFCWPRLDVGTVELGSHRPSPEWRVPTCAAYLRGEGIVGPAGSFRRIIILE